MSLIAGKDVAKSYGEREVLAGVTFVLAEGDRVGFVGPNGEGKTTLLRLLAGLEEPSNGAVTRRGGLRIGYLPQDPPAGTETTLWDSVLEVFADLRGMEAELHERAGRLTEAERHRRRYDALLAEFERRGGYAYEARIKAALTGLGFTPDQYDQALAQLSGGQRSRAMLARLLLEEPDVLLLDETTNHLDLDATEWLERWLQGCRPAMVIVSHDRYLLDHVTRTTWAIGFGRLERYPGNYSAHLRQREVRRKEHRRLWALQQEHIRRTEDFIRRYHAGQRHKEARGRRTRLDRFLETEAVEQPREHRTIRVRLAPGRRSGDLVLATDGLTIGYDAAAPLAAVPDLEVRRGRRIALIGANGIGKTTLLRTLLGDLAPLAGAVRHGANVEPGYLPQTHDILDPAWTLLETVREARPQMLPAEVRHLLGRFLFSGDDVFKTVGQLSGGERSRVVLARLVARGTNLLILDEPTNHLDIPSREVLERMLRTFEGTVILVTHDRYLVRAVATDIWVMDPTGFHRMKGDWEAFLRWRSARSAAAGAPPGAASRTKDRRAEKRRVSKRRLSRQKGLESDIATKEQELRDLTEAMNRASAAGDVEEVRRLSETYEHEQAGLDRLWDEWTELSERLEA